MKKIFAVLLILVAVFASYAPSVRNGFVWDDTALVLRDPLIRSWRLIPEGFNHFLFTDATASDFYRPLQRLSYTLNYAVFAFRPGPYHVTSVLCHAAAALALFFLAEELLLALGVADRRRTTMAFLAALVWAIHPLQTAAVVYISGRADPLAAFFGFTGLYLVLRALRATKWSSALFMVAAAAAFLLAALSRETGLLFPIMAMAILGLRRSWSDLWKVLGAGAIVCAAYFGLRMGAEHFPAPVLSPPPPLLVRPIVVTRAVAEYTGLFLFPLNLHMDRDVESHPAGFGDASLSSSAWRELQTLAGIAAIAALIYWMVRAYKRNFPVFVCLTLFVICYLPVSGIVALNATVAEHWMYLPSAFLFLAAVLQIAALIPSQTALRSTIRVSASVIVVAWIIFLGARTFARTFDWKNERTFFERTIACGGDSARMLINLGGLELSEGKLEDAAIHLHAALQRKPDQPFALIDLAAIALKQNDFKLARELLGRAAKMDAVDARAYQLLAVLESLEHHEVDLLRWRLAARTGPPDWSIEKRYIMVLDQAGSTGAAIDELIACLWTQWYRADSWYLLSQLEAKAGHADRATNALSRARAYDVHFDEHVEP